MTPKAEYISQNKTSREALLAYLQSLSPSDLAHPMDAGWTVSAVLCHLAFWDLRALTLIELFLKSGVRASAIDTDVINETTRLLCLAVPGPEAVKLTIDSALRLDALIETLSVEMIAEIETAAPNVRLERGHHRYMHMEDIQKTLGH